MTTTVERRVLLGVAVWLFLFGIWPVADPGHRDWSPMVLADLLLHTIGVAYLAYRFRTYKENT